MTRSALPDRLDELRKLERQLEREWWWLHGALNAVAQMQGERQRGTLTTFREMQRQVRELDRRRVQIAVRLAEIQTHDAAPSKSSADCQRIKTYGPARGEPR